MKGVASPILTVALSLPFFLAFFSTTVQGKSMRVFINNAVVDAMDYLEVDLIT